MLRRAFHLLWLTPLAVAGLVLAQIVDGNLEHWLGRNWLPVACLGMLCLSLLARWHADRPRISSAARPIFKPGRCVSCGYNLRDDPRNPNFCPRCGSSQSQEAHLRRRRELMLEMERLQMEFVRNHQDRIT